MTAKPHIHRVGFMRGFKWLLFGADLTGRRPAALMPVAALFLLVSLVQVIPVVGPGLLVLITPLLTAGLLTAFWKVSHGQAIEPWVLFAGWQDERARGGLLTLGMWMILGLILAIWVLSLWLAPQLSPGQIERAMEDPEQLLQLLVETRWLGGVSLAGLVLAAVLGAVYFGVPLVRFNHFGVGPAMAWSLRAVIGNWAAFLGLTCSILVFSMAVGLLLGLISGLLGIALGALAGFPIKLLYVLTVMLVQVVMAGAQYVAYREVFVWPEVESGAPPELQA